MNKYFEFLVGRKGADDSDVDALQRAFELNINQAAFIYRCWLNSL